MSHTPHQLAEEFPESAELLRALSAQDTHFVRLKQEYEDVNLQIHRMETNVEPAGEALQTVLRRKRMMLKDEIYAHLKAAVAGKGAGDGEPLG